MACSERIIDELLSGSGRSVRKGRQIRGICAAAKQAFMGQPMLLKLHAPIIVVGDIHGQYSDLLRLFELTSYPPDSDFLFLGDFVDRGPQSIEVITLLLALKTRYSDNVYLLRGNHESSSVNRRYGFYDECVRKYGRRSGHRVWRAFNRAFDWMPVAAVVAGQIFCVHGGLSPHLRHLRQIDQIRRPARVPRRGVMCDLLWADPCSDVRGWRRNSHRNTSYEFGADRVVDFLNRFDFRLVVRAHQCVRRGYKYFADYRLVTVFSAPNYKRRRYPGAVMSVDRNANCTFITLPALVQHPLAAKVTRRPRPTRKAQRKIVQIHGGGASCSFANNPVDVARNF
ncbi:uncharacterized protein LOC126837036 [Adelges cooleyi]|uniref:uncharacterized protein LOC126837036 n=1 Tax=Adelges cooleyi TaxID=133065 RepID=UPI0021801A91|nr:uncharacterized protein LOC126837036 [Adelges cooleyi]